MPTARNNRKKLSSQIIGASLHLLKPFDQVKVLLSKLLSLTVVRIFLVSLALIIVAPLVFFFIVRPVPQKTINYGVTFSKKYAQELGQDWQSTYIKILDDLKVKNLRLVAYWDEIEPQRGIYNFSDINWQLDEADKRGVNVIMTIGRKVPRYPECFEPQWWKDTKIEELRNDELYQYIQKAVITLKNHKSIFMWQVENEPFFPFGTCVAIKRDVVKHEIALVRELDKRPILTQDSGEGGFWYPSYVLGDYLGISMYRKIWYDFWGVFFGRFIYFQYPLASWSYKVRAAVVNVPYQKIIVTELQAEPWGPGSNAKLSQEEADKTMSRQDFISTIDYAQKAGFKDLYFWGVEWWLMEKDKLGNPFYWDTAKALFN
jgi:hypothetical protein